MKIQQKFSFISGSFMQFILQFKESVKAGNDDKESSGLINSL